MSKPPIAFHQDLVFQIQHYLRDTLLFMNVPKEQAISLLEKIAVAVAAKTEATITINGHEISAQVVRNIITALSTNNPDRASFLGGDERLHVLVGQDGNFMKIATIKYLRTFGNFGLKDAKDIVDSIEANANKFLG
jgi:ribosomal protein L7/L12